MKDVQQEPPKEKRMAESAADKYRKAIEAAEKIKKDAVDELIKEINLKIADLNGFGYEYSLTEELPAPVKAKKPTGTPRQKSEMCKICQFSTTPLHDGRYKAHREQGTTKKPFTDKELAAHGLTKVA